MKHPLKYLLRTVALALLLLFLLAGCTLPPLEEQEGPVLNLEDRHLFIVADQENNCVSLYDLNDEDWSKPRWTWTTKNSHFTHVDGLKYRFDAHAGTDVIALCSSGGYCAVVSYPLGEALYYVPNAGGNPHSVEILPDGAFVVSATNGNYVRIYDTTYPGDVSNKYTQLTIPVAHGVLWDDELNLLWVLSDTRLYGVNVDENHEMTILDNMTVPLGSHDGHDLQPVYGDSDLLWVTTNTNVIQIRKSTLEALTVYPGRYSISAMTSVKGIGSFPDGTLIMAQANGAFREWNTDRVTIGLFSAEEDRYYLETRELPGAIYKLRVFEKNYH